MGAPTKGVMGIRCALNDPPNGRRALVPPEKPLAGDFQRLLNRNHPAYADSVCNLVPSGAERFQNNFSADRIVAEEWLRIHFM
jgi:hypothetical protein